MGWDCRDVAEENWEQAIVGYTTVLDMTEESILKGNDYVQGNPRYLTIVKNFPTFFSFGPELVTPDEVPDVLKLEVQSVHNGELYAKNTVSNMTHRPARLVSLHSSIQGWLAGDVLSTGTPRAFQIQDGDTAECRIFGPDGFEMKPLGKSCGGFKAASGEAVKSQSEERRAEQKDDSGKKNSFRTGGLKNGYGIKE